MTGEADMSIGALEAQGRDRAWNCFIAEHLQRRRRSRAERAELRRPGQCHVASERRHLPNRQNWSRVRTADMLHLRDQCQRYECENNSVDSGGVAGLMLRERARMFEILHTM